MLSQTSEHALRAVLFLARRPPREPVSADVIATALSAPRNYLSKTLNALVKHGVVASARGPHGGFWLAVPAERLTLARVIEAFDEPRNHTSCLLGGAVCCDKDPCFVHFRWKAVAADVWEPLRSTTVADLLNGATLGRIAAGATAGTSSRTAAPAVRTYFQGSKP